MKTTFYHASAYCCTCEYYIGPRRLDMSGTSVIVETDTGGCTHPQFRGRHELPKVRTEQIGCLLGSPSKYRKWIPLEECCRMVGYTD